MVTEITMHELDELIEYGSKSLHLTVVMFYGPTCGPCKATLPFYEEASNYYHSLGANISFYRINAWEPEEQMTYCREKWKINGVPQFKVFYDKNIVFDRAGGGDLEMLRDLINESIDTCFKEYGARI
jgi:thiol-disulfide isomerase/thioredoxin